MLFVNLMTLKPGLTREQINDVAQRRARWKYPPEIKLIAEYWVPGSPNIIAIVEAEGAGEILGLTYAWNDAFDIATPPRRLRRRRAARPPARRHRAAQGPAPQGPPGPLIGPRPTRSSGGGAGAVEGRTPVTQAPPAPAAATLRARSFSGMGRPRTRGP